MATKKENRGLTRLKIKLNGDTPGLKDHRLSIDAFQGSFDALLKAARRIASGIITQAIDKTDYGTGGGKYAEEASRLDLQLASVGEGSDTQVELVLDVKPPYQKGLLEEHDLIFRVGEEILEAVREESQGKLRNAKIKAYLESLDAGLTSQTYELWRNGRRVGKPVEVGKLDFS